ncbi:MAG: hypothetical protein ACRD6W_07110 [Nitrososphaerales archaeon]
MKPNKLSQEKVDEIVSLAGANEATIAKRVGVSRWTVHHYLELAGKTRLGGGKWLKPAPGSVVKQWTFALYYNKGMAKRGYPWVVESSEGTVELAREVAIVGRLSLDPAKNPSRIAWTPYDPNPNPRLTKRPSYVRGVFMIHGVITITN